MDSGQDSAAFCNGNLSSSVMYALSCEGGVTETTIQ